MHGAHSLRRAAGTDSGTSRRRALSHWRDSGDTSATHGDKGRPAHSPHSERVRDSLLPYAQCGARGHLRQTADCGLGTEFRHEVDYARTFVRQLRKKIEDDPSNPRYLLTDAYVGYRFAESLPAE